MGSLNKKLGNSSSIKLGLGILLCSTFLYTSYGHGKEGLSKSRQAKLIRPCNGEMSIAMLNNIREINIVLKDGI